MRVTVEKSLPGDDALPSLPRSTVMVLWWKRVFEGDPEVDVSVIPDRKANNEGLEKHKLVATPTLSSFRFTPWWACANKTDGDITQAWKEAHEMFREKIKGLEPVAL